MTKAQVNCDLYIAFSALLCVEPQEDYSQQFVLEESLARQWDNLVTISSNLGRQFYGRYFDRMFIHYFTIHAQ